MRAAFSNWRHWPGTLIGLGLLLLLSACATTKVDWNARVGHYTYAQAVLDLGPPDNEAHLPNGTIVAQWLIYRGTLYAYGVPFGGPFGYFNTYTTPNRYLRLTFGPSGELTAWKYFYK
jgi:hypothetical protein